MNISDPALTLTLLCHSNQPEGIAVLVQHLARPAEAGGLALETSEAGLWQDQAGERFLIRFTPINAPDLTLIQVALNASGADESVWKRLLTRLNNALSGMPSDAEEALIGTTLVYQGVTEDPETAGPALLQKNAVASLNQQALSHVLAKAMVPGGMLWLLASPDVERNEAVYLALATPAEQNALVFDVLFGEEAGLIWPDAILHKTNFLTRDYFGGGRRGRFMKVARETIEYVAQRLEENATAQLEELNELNRRIAAITTIQAELRRIRSELDVQQQNFERAIATRPWDGDLWQYLGGRIDRTIVRIGHDVEEVQAGLDASTLALQSLRADYELRQARAAERSATLERRTNYILAAVAIIFTVGQVIDIDRDVMLWRARAMLATVVVVAIAAFLLWRYRQRDQDENN